MKKIYIAPRIVIEHIGNDNNHLLASSNLGGMDIPSKPTPGVSGDAKFGIFEFSDSDDFMDEMDN